MAIYRFHCSECSFGDREIGTLEVTEIYCAVCLEEEGQLIRLHCWEEEEEADQALLRTDLLAA